MKAHHVSMAVRNVRLDTRNPQYFLDDFFTEKAIRFVVALLKELAKNTSGWKVWLRWAFRVIIAALEAYLKLVGDGDGA